jgi:hypothetical protein
MTGTTLRDVDPEVLARALAEVSTPSAIETPFGTFELVDGVPTGETAERLYDALDLVRGIDVFMNCVPGASLVAMRRGFRSIGLTGSTTVGYTDPRANSGSFFLTPNTETTYGSCFIDLNENGPMVIEPPKESLCVVDDFWFRYVTDMGIAGPDHGQGGRYLFLPPGHDGDVPDGYYVFRPDTFTIWVVLRALGGVTAMKETNIYRLRATLDTAARTAAAMSRALVYAPRDPDAFVFDGSSWLQAFVGGSYEFLHNGARLLDARTAFHYFATVITPAMAHAQVGAGSAYAYTVHDGDGAILDGAKTYTLTLPPNPPAKNFWSIDVYDTQTRSLLQTDDPYPSVMSLGEGAAANADGSYTLTFGPEAPADGARNWVQTTPGKSWFPMLRLYGPLEAWFDKTWQPGEIQPN